MNYRIIATCRKHLTCHTVVTENKSLADKMYRWISLDMYSYSDITMYKEFSNGKIQEIKGIKLAKRYH